MAIKNSQGKIWYGIHFYPGVAEYREEGKSPSRVFLNENTLRKMDSTFAGRPVFVSHVDGVEQNIDKLRNDADGWVIESFFNEADGKHWAKFITVSERAEKAIQNGMRLSNAYFQKSTTTGGLWNGVEYEREITDGEYEHLAIVPNPRYEESVIMSPEQFKKYNEDKKDELKRIANSKSEGDNMKFLFFKKQKVENSDGYENLSVLLPESKKEVSIQELVTNADKAEKEKDKPRLVNDKDLVEVDGEKISVKDLKEKYENAKKCNEDEDEEDEKKENEDDMDEDEDEAVENEDDDEDEDEKKDKKENKKKKNTSDKKDPHPNAEKLKYADRDHDRKKVKNSIPRLDGVERGKKLFGSSK